MRRTKPIAAQPKRTRRPKKTGGDLRQINQLDQPLRSGINTAGATLSHRPGGTSCEVILIFLTRQFFDYLPSFFSVSNAVVVGTQISGVAFGSLQAPDETRDSVGQGVDFVEPCDKAGHQRIIESSFYAPDVDLCDVKIGHRFSSQNDRRKAI